MKIQKKVGVGGSGGRGRVEGGGQGGCDRKIEVFGKIKKNIFFFGGGGGGRGVLGRGVLGRGVGWWVGQGGCE